MLTVNRREFILSKDTGTWINLSYFIALLILVSQE